MAKPKLTPWFPAHTPPARVGLYEIRGASFHSPNFRRWNRSGWSGTWASPSPEAQNDYSVKYGSAEDMTGWRGLASDPRAAK